MTVGQQIALVGGMVAFLWFFRAMGWGIVQRRLGLMRQGMALFIYYQCYDERYLNWRIGWCKTCGEDPTNLELWSTLFLIALSVSVNRERREIRIHWLPCRYRLGGKVFRYRLDLRSMRLA